MSLAALKAAGVFADPAPKETTVESAGDTFRVWVVRQSAYEMQHALREIKDAGTDLTDPDIVRYALVHLRFRFGDDMEQMTLADAMRITPEFLDALEAAFREIEPLPKASRPKKRSGTS